MNIVKYHNDINKIKLGNFSERELDIFFSIVFKLKNQKTDTIILEFSELKNLSNAKVRNNSRLIESIKNISKKLIQLNQEMVLPNGDIVLFNLFRTLTISENNSSLKVSVNEDFQYMLNDLIGNFTMFELKKFTMLKSSYSKNMFRILKQWQGTCKFIIDLNEFKELLKVPNNITTSNFNKDIIKPIKTELQTVFKNLEIKKLTNSKEPVKQGQKTKYLLFTWHKTEKKLPQNSISPKIEEVKVKTSNIWIEEKSEFEKVQVGISLELINMGISPVSIEFKELNDCKNLEELSEFIKKYDIHIND